MKIYEKLLYVILIGIYFYKFNDYVLLQQSDFLHKIYFNALLFENNKFVNDTFSSSDHLY